MGGVAVGGLWGLFPSILSDLFGPRYFATLYTCIQMAPAVGNILATFLTGWLYDLAEKRQTEQAFALNQDLGLPAAAESFSPLSPPPSPSDGASAHCLGYDCYRPAWIILTAVNLISLIGSCILMKCTWEVYRRG